MALHDAYHSKGLRILAFPCNQFGKQEPGLPSEIRSFADGYGVQFDMFAKVDVNGSSAHPVFLFVRSRLSDVLGSSVKWNWTKFLCDRDGQPVKRFSPATSPSSMVPAIEALLAQPPTPVDMALAPPPAEAATERA